MEALTRMLSSRKMVCEQFVSFCFGFALGFSITTYVAVVSFPVVPE